MDSEKLIERLRTESLYADKASLEIMDLCMEAATALSTLQAENEKLRDELEQERDHRLHAEEHADLFLEDCKRLNVELEQVKRLYESEKEDFIDFACSGVPNLSPYCLNRHQDCVDERGWCRTEKCRGFSRGRGQKED